MIDKTPNMTSNTTPSPYVASASSIFSSGYDAWLAFTTNASNRWNNDSSAMPAWLELDFGSGQGIVCQQYALTAANSNYQIMPQSWNFQGSPDGSAWTTLDTQSSVPGWSSSGETRNYSFSNSVQYRYYRIYITNTFGGGNANVSISRLAFFAVSSSLRRRRR